MDEMDVHITNNLSLTDKEIVLHASGRSKIDEFYRDTKDNLDLDTFGDPLRTFRKINFIYFSR